jgi:hypothetical protein
MVAVLVSILAVVWIIAAVLFYFQRLRRKTKTNAYSETLELTIPPVLERHVLEQQFLAEKVRQERERLAWSNSAAQKPPTAEPGL